MNSKTLWKFETANFIVRWTIEPDYDVDASFDETGETQEKLDSGEYVAFNSIVTVTHKGTGADLGSSALCGSIYANPAKFRDHIGSKGKWGSYFTDLVKEAISEARDNLADLGKVRTRH